MVEKISLPLQAPKALLGEEARNWYRRRNFVVCPLVLITSVNSEGMVNAAVKTNFMTVDSMTRYAFHCSPQHHTNRNIMETKEFVINVPTEDIIGKVLNAAILTMEPCLPRVNEIERAGLTPIPSEKVKPPRVQECVAHYECVLDWHKDGLILGRAVAVSVDKGLLGKPDGGRMIVVGGGRTPDTYGVVCETKVWPKWLG